jgi:hypothetical protein
VTATAFGLNHFLSKLLCLGDLLDLNPTALVLSDEHIVEFLLLLDRLEVIDDDTDEQVDDELTADDHKNDEE